MWSSARDTFIAESVNLEMNSWYDAKPVERLKQERDMVSFTFSHDIGKQDSSECTEGCGQRKQKIRTAVFCTLIKTVFSYLGYSRSETTSTKNFR